MGTISVDKLNIGEPNRNGIFMEHVDVSSNVSFTNCDIKGDVWLRRVTVEWDCDFNYSRIKSDFIFELSKVKGKLDFNRVIFNYPYAQRNASREAKRVWDKLGDKDKKDKYYFNERDAVRKTRGMPGQYIEWFFIQISVWIWSEMV